MSLSRLSFDQRLARARAMLAAAADRQLPQHIHDQIGAAAKDAFAFHADVVSTLRTIDPHRRWQARSDEAPSEARAYLLAALLICAPCPHLRGGGPQPGIARLPLKRLDCHRCAGTFRRPPPEDDDACDLCGRHGITWFTPFVVTSGPATLTGDLCATCAGALGLPVKAQPGTGREAA